MHTIALLPRQATSAAILLAALLLPGEAAAETHQPTLDCVVLPDAEADIGSATAGVIARVLADRSQRIEAGEALVELEASMEHADLALASTRASLDTEVDLYTASVAYERRRRARTSALHNQKVVSAQENDQVDTEAVLASLRLQQARDRKRLAGLEMARAQAALARRTVRSPFAGVVVERYKVAGEYVDEQPLMRIARLDPLRVEVIVPNELFGTITPGMRAEVLQQLPGSPPREATVRLLDPVGDPASGTFTVRLELPNPELAILAGTRCTARFMQAAPRSFNRASLDSRSTMPDAASVEAGAHAASAETTAPPTPTPNRPVVAPLVAKAPDRTAISEDRQSERAETLPAVVNVALFAAREAQPRDGVDHLGAAPARECSRLGPLSDRDDVAALVERLREHGVEQVDVLAVAPRTDGDLVVLTDTPVARLRALGLTDIAELHQGVHAGRVSLGIYRGAVSAGIRREQVAALGVVADVQPQRPAPAQWWVQLDRDADAAGLPGDLTRSGLEQGECPRVVTASR